MTKGSLLVLGLGNPILSDDSIALRLIEDLRAALPLPGVEYASASCGGLELLERTQGYDEVVLLDGIRTEGGRPGSVARFPLGALPATRHVASLHDVGLPTAMELGRSLGLPEPRSFQVVAIEIVEDRIASQELSPLLAAAYPRILQEVAVEITRLARPRKG